MTKLITGSIALSTLLFASSCDLINPTPTDTNTNTQTDNNQNVEPNASFTSSTINAQVPFNAVFNGSASSDSDGSIVKYQWFISNVLQSETSSTLNQAFNTAGSYVVSLIVTDNEGATDRQDVTVIATAASVTVNEKPTALFTMSPTSIGVAPLSINFDAGTSRDDQMITSYSWNVDGSIYTTQTFSHTFDGATGTYPVTLSVWDAQGLSDSLTQNVTITAQAPLNTPSISSNVTTGEAPLSVNFTGSQPTNGTAPYTFNWDINGQIIPGQVINHVFQDADDYVVELTVEDALGAIGKNTINITVTPEVIVAPLVASASANITSGQAPLSVMFDGSGSDGQYDIVSYSWLIDGQTYSGETYTHLFSNAGTYPVTLSVEDNQNRTSTAQLSISVGMATGNRAPVADAGANITTPENTTVTFDGSGSSDLDGDTLSYTWSVDDYVTINPITGEMPTFTFNQAGIHEVTLSVTDGQFTDTDTMTVTVEAASAQSPMNRIRYNGEDLYLSGFNIAWFDFAQDFNIADTSARNAKLREAIADLKASGGNTLRWWVHIDGSTSPAWSNNLVSGPGTNFIRDLRSALDIAASEDVLIIPSLWSFDMLKTNGYRTVPANDNYRILTEDAALQAYIDNALIPMVDALNGHEALVAWELFNEPENMTEPWFAQDAAVNINNTNGVDELNLEDIQRTTAKMAVAIHQRAIDNGEIALVTTGSKSMAKYNSDVSTDPDSKGNLYRDDRLMALANNNPLATLDFYQPHYYNNESKGGDWSPYHHPASYWEVNKPIVIGEIYVDLGIKDNITRAYWSETLKPEYEEIEGDNMCQRLVEMGYAGAWPWQYNEQPENMMACLSLVNPQYDANDGNTRPNASFTVGATGDAPITINFNGVSSNDPDGSITNYEWRVNNTIVGSNSASLNHRFETANSYKVRLVVTDNLGKKSEAAVEFVELAGALPICDKTNDGKPYCPAGTVDTDAPPNDTDGWSWNNTKMESCVIFNSVAIPEEEHNSCTLAP